MFVSENLNVNSAGHLAVAGVDTVSLAKEYGTPLYVMDEALIRQNCSRFVNSIKDNYNGGGLALYASKALSCKEIYRIVASEGMGVDVVSGGELHTALSVGFEPQNICFHGNNKTENELEMALNAKVGYIAVDNFEELERLNLLAGQLGKTAKIMFRIKPGVDAHTHEFVMTGQIDSKFGVALETGEAFEIIRLASAMKNVEVTGVHCHIGSNIFDVDPFLLASERLLELILKVKNELGIEIGTLNLGGGFGIKYLPEHDPVSFEEYMSRVSVTVKKFCKDNNLNMPFIMIEPGRSVVAGAGLTLYTVGSVKTIPGVRTYVSVDGGMTDNPRYALYKSEYDMALANKAGLPKTETVTVAGRCCESGDLLGENISLQQAKTGDILTVFATGAYNYSMSSNYNRLPKPAMVMIKDGESRVVIRRESYDDLIRNDL